MSFKKKVEEVDVLWWVGFAAWVLAPTSLITAMIIGIAAALQSSTQLGAVAGIFAVFAVICFFVGAVVYDI